MIFKFKKDEDQLIQVRLTVHYIDENGKALGPDNHLMNSRDHHFRLTAPPLIGYDFQKAILPNGQHVKDPTVAGTMSGETPELTFVYTTADSLIHQPKPATLVIK